MRRLPIDQLGTLLQRRVALSAARLGTVTAPAPVDPEIAAWQAAWRAALAAIPDRADGQPDLLWYVRRRTVAFESQLVGTAVPVTGDDAAFTAALNTRLGAIGLTARVDALRARATPFASARLTSFLGSARVLPSDLLLSAAVKALEAIPQTGDTPQPLREGDVLGVAETFGDPQLGDGLARLATALGDPPLTAAEIAFLADNNAVLDFDRMARDASDTALTAFAALLRPVVTASDAAGLASLIATGA